MRFTCRKMATIILLLLSATVCLLLCGSNVRARSQRPGVAETDTRLIQSSSTSLPNPQQRVHRVPDVQVCMTNWGLLGSQMRYMDESLGGCFNPNPDEESPAPSFEYPSGSALEYLFWGAIWIGARVSDSAYTSVGCDGWQWIHELWPEAGEAGAIEEASVFPDVPCYSPNAISGQDIIAVYTDTSADIPLSPQQRDPWDNRKHFPLGIEVTQTSYSWNGEGLDKFIIAEYIIKNIGVKLLSELYIGLYVDADCQRIDENPWGPYGATDDITGFLKSFEIGPGDTRTVDIGWIADNDGHGITGETIWSEFSPRSVLGVKVLRPPHPEVPMSYNWWIPNYAGHPKDWGPWLASSQDVWAGMNPYGSGSLFPDNVLGTPGGDVSKYFIMSNGEFDYDQAYACVWPDDHPEEGWLPSSPECQDLADGKDTRFLLSFGPFDQLVPGDSLILAAAYVIGDSLHVDPLNYPNPVDPDGFYSNLYFGDLVRNALTAESLYYALVFNRAPAAFSLLFPPNKAFTPRRVTFDWEDAVDPDTADRVWYDLYVSTSYYFYPHTTMIWPWLTESRYSRVLEEGVYFWKVRARDNRGAERWSDQVRSFIVTGIPHISLGDFDGDGTVDIGDVIFAINHLYRSGPAPDPLELGDANCDDSVDGGDVVYLIDYLFRNGPTPGKTEPQRDRDEIH